MASGIFNVGVSGLSAAQIGIQTTSHNIANASTSGYNRQQTVQTTNTPMFTGSGYIGQGANVQTVQRVYSAFLSQQVLSAQTVASQMEVYQTQVEQIDNLLADPSAGLGPGLEDFFGAVQEVAAYPSSIPARQSLISSAQSLAARFQGLDQRIQEVRDGVNSQILAQLQNINSMTTQIGELNQRIILAQAAGSNQPANDLLDQRDQLVTDLNKLIRVQTVVQDDGTYNVFIGNGQPVVVGSVVSTLSGVQAPDDPEKIAVQMNSPYGGSFVLLESLLSGGALGGLLNFRAETLDIAQNALGRIAMAMASQFNAIHASGQDLIGNLGTDFFAVPVPVTNASVLNANPTTALDAQIIDSDYRLVFNGASFDVTRLSDGTSFNGLSMPAVLDGVTVSLTAGIANPGDVFVVRPGNRPGARVISEATNTGNAELDSTGSNFAALTDSDYRIDYVAANQWRLTRLSDLATWTSIVGVTEQDALDDLQQYQPGFSMTLSGAPPSVGDSFVIQPTRRGARDLAVAITDPNLIAAAAPFRTSATSTNTGVATISSGSVEYRDDSLPNLPLGTSPAGDIVLTFDAGTNTFAISGAYAGTVNYDPGTQTGVDISINGLTFRITGRPDTGDTFILAANANGVSDNRIAQMLGALQTTNVLNGVAGQTTSGATATYTSAYSQIVSQIGAKARQVEIVGQAQQALVDQASNAKESLSGVNLDEEAANLLKFQQAYQAAAKMLDIASKLFEEILAVGR